MQIDDSKKLLLSDTLVPDIFVTEYLPALSGLAVKIYIYLLLTAKSHREINEADLARRMGSDVDTVKAALLELSACQLVSKRDEQLIIQDIKALEIEKIYRPRTSSDPQLIAAQQNQFSEREKLLSDISKTFFQGLMSPSWYGEIDAWFDRFGFEPEVIYALFQECARRNKLDSKAYISRVAENWSMRGIISYKDLNQYFMDYDKIKKVSKQIASKLRKTITEYDEEIITRWIEKMGYDFSIIELALRKTVKLSNPNLAYIDKILEEWFSHQLKSVDEIKAYEKEKQQRVGKHKASSKTAESRNSNIGNFKQRQYSDDYLQGFFEDFTEPQRQPADQKKTTDKKITTDQKKTTDKKETDF